MEKNKLRHIVTRPFEREQQTSVISTKNLTRLLQSLEKQANKPLIPSKPRDIFPIPLEQTEQEILRIIQQTSHFQSSNNALFFYYFCLQPSKQEAPRQYSFLATLNKTIEIMRKLDRYFESSLIELVLASQFVYYPHNQRIEQEKISIQSLRRMPATGFYSPS